MSDNRKLLLGMAVVFAGAMLLRSLHLIALESAWRGTQLFSLARGDAAHHWREAQQILDHDFWLRDRVFWKGPGYSYFLALAMKLVGRDPGNLRWVVAILGSLNCALLVRLCARFLRLRWSILAGLLAATNGLVILFDGELFFPTLLILLNLVAIDLLAEPRRTLPRTLAAGAFLGLAALVHPVYLLPAATLGLYLMSSSRKIAVVFVAGVALVVLPNFARNVIVRGEPVLISWSGGINLYIGNQPGFDQASGQSTSAWARVVNTPRDAGLDSESRIDRFYLERALRQAGAHPVEALEILLTKLRLLFSPVEIANNIRIYEFRKFSPVLRVTLWRAGPLWFPFGMFAPLAIVGLYGSLGSRNPRFPLTPVLLAWSIGLALSMILAFNTARYRVPLVFFSSVWVAYALRAAVSSYRARRWNSLLGGLAGFVALVVVVGLCARPQRTFPPPYERSEAQVLEVENRPQFAGMWMDKALEHHPDDALVAIDAVQFYGRQHQYQKQEPLIETLLDRSDLEPDNRCRVLEERARSFLARGQWPEARSAVSAALDLHVDRCEWQGAPFFQMDSAPSTACRLRVLLAQIELRSGNRGRARELVAGVKDDCPGYEGIPTELK